MQGKFSMLRSLLALTGMVHPRLLPPPQAKQPVAHFKSKRSRDRFLARAVHAWRARNDPTRGLTNYECNAWYQQKVPRKNPPKFYVGIRQRIHRVA